MRKTILLILVMTCSSFAQTDFTELMKLHENKDLFRFISLSGPARNSFSGWQKKYLDALVLNLKSKNSESNRVISEILNDSSYNISDSLVKQLYETRLNNSVHLFDYADAYFCSKHIMESYPAMIDSVEMANLENSLKIWKAVTLPGKQTVEIIKDTKITSTRDMAGLINVPVSCGGVTEDFIFDTGANFSVVTESMASKMKLKMLDGAIEVGAITGKTISSKLGYAEELKIGALKFSNVVFLVMPDESLSFAGGLYKIKGVIGLPVIKAMKEVHFKDDHIFVPGISKPASFSNLLIDGFVTVISVISNGDSLAFTFDTGAKKTLLYSSYYQKYQKMIDENYEVEDIEFGGAGGTVKVKGYKLNNVILNVGTSEQKMDNLSLLSESLKDHDKSYFGNLGQDFLGEFSEMIMNFEYMYVDLKK